MIPLGFNDFWAARVRSVYIAVQTNRNDYKWMPTSGELKVRVFAFSLPIALIMRAVCSQSRRWGLSGAVTRITENVHNSRVNAIRALNRIRHALYSSRHREGSHNCSAAS